MKIAFTNILNTNGVFKMAAVLGVGFGVAAGAVHADSVTFDTLYGSGTGSTAIASYPFLISGGSYTYTADITHGGAGADWKIFSYGNTGDGASYTAANAIWDNAPTGGTESISNLTSPSGNNLLTWQASDNSTSNLLGLQYSNATSAVPPVVATGSGGTSDEYVFFDPNNAPGAAGASEQFTQTMISSNEKLSVYFYDFVGSAPAGNVAAVINASTSGGGSMNAVSFTGSALQQNGDPTHLEGIFTIDVSGSAGDVVTVTLANPATPAASNANIGLFGATVEQSTPEPATLAVFILGGAGLLLTRRRNSGRVA